MSPRISHFARTPSAASGLERLKGEFLNIAAHELRSPLGIVSGYVSMLLDGTLSGTDRHTALERIAEKSDEMARLITDMLDTARMEALGMELVLRPTDLLTVIADAMRRSSRSPGVAIASPRADGGTRFRLSLTASEP